MTSNSGGLTELLARNRSAIESHPWAAARKRFFSPAALSRYDKLIPRLQRYARGVIPDAGCGSMPFRGTLQRLGVSYTSLDIQSSTKPDLLGDIQDMSMVQSGSFDSVLCIEVLEHVPRPDRAIAEIWRVLKPGGLLIASVPLLARLHDEPHDYHRFTQHGLRYLLEEAGFRVIEIEPAGSLFSFVGHQVSTLAVGGTWHLPGLRYLVFWLNALVCSIPCFYLDRLFRLERKIPLGYVVIAERYN